MVRGRGSRSAQLPAVTGSRGGAACAARAGAKSVDSGLSAAAPHTAAPWRQGRGRLRARDGSGCGQLWGSLRAGSGPALPPPRGRGHFVGTRSGYSGPARSAGEAGGGGRGPAPLCRHLCKATRRRAGRGKWGGSTGPPPLQRDGPARAASPREWGTQGAANTRGYSPVPSPRQTPRVGAADGTGVRPPPFSPDCWQWEHSSPKQVSWPRLGAECCWVPSSSHDNCAIISCSVIAVGAIKWL